MLFNAHKLLAIQFLWSLCKINNYYALLILLTHYLIIWIYALKHCVFVLTTAGSLSFLKHPSNQIININQTAIFECVVTGGDTITIKWEKDGRLLSNRNVTTHKTNNRTTSNLTLDRATVKDSGKYRCKATNADDGDVTSVEAPGL